MKRVGVFCISFYLFSVLTSSTSLASFQKELTKVSSKTEKMEETIRKQSMALLSLIKTMYPAGVSERTEMVKLVKTQGKVYASDDTSSRVISEPRLNDEFPIIEHRNQWYFIKLEDGREGWIQEDEIQLFWAPEAPAKRELSVEIQGGEARRFVNLAEELYSEIQYNSEEALGLIDKTLKTFEELSEDEKSNFREDINLLNKRRERIEKYRIYAKHFYQRHIEGMTFGELTEGKRAMDFSAWLSLLAGNSSYERKNLGDEGKREKTTFRDINAGGTLNIGDHSKILASLAHRNEVLQTPYNTNKANLGYQLMNLGGFNLNAHLNYYAYNDKEFDQNDYGIVSLGGRAQYSINPDAVLNFDYRFRNKSFKKESDDEYLANQIEGGLRLTLNPRNRLLFNLTSIFQSSDANYLNFNRFQPRLELVHCRSPFSTMRLAAEFEGIAYEGDAELNNLNREKIELTWSSKSGRKSSHRRIGIVAKQFPNNKDLSYIKFREGWSRSTIGVNSSNTYLSLVTTIHTQSKGSQKDYSDLRFDRMDNLKYLYFNLSLFGRVWHDMASDDIPDHLLDFYNRFGINIGGIKIGPSLGMHTLISKNEKFFKRDGNSFRVGGTIEGNLVLPHRILLNLSSSYNRGFVYASSLTVDPSTGDITYGELSERHPVTLQINSAISMPIIRSVDFRMNIGYYKIEPDTDEETSINPVDNYSRFKIAGGLNYRFN